MEFAIVTNTETGQRGRFPLPFQISALEKIGVTESFKGQLYVLPEEDDTFGYGLDGFLELSELKAYLEDYKNRQNPYHFDYMMLSRLQTDCDYFLGYGGRYERHLWAGNVPDQIAEMKKLWKKFPEGGKPEWLTWEEILQYERRMTEEDK